MFMECERTLNNFLKANNVFDRSIKRCKQYLNDWWDKDPKSFNDVLLNNYNVVNESYEFKIVESSFNSNYNCESVFSYLSVCIYICDNDGNDLVEYVAYYDKNLEDVNFHKF